MIRKAGPTVVMMRYDGGHWERGHYEPEPYKSQLLDTNELRKVQEIRDANEARRRVAERRCRRFLCQDFLSRFNISSMRRGKSLECEAGALGQRTSPEKPWSFGIATRHRSEDTDAFMTAKECLTIYFRSRAREQSKAPPQNTADWSHTIAESPDWIWRDGRLFHRLATQPKPEAKPSKKSPGFQWLIMRMFYARSDSPRVRKLVAELVADLKADEFGLNLGAGGVTMGPQMLNLDVRPAPSVHVTAYDQTLPFRDNSLSLVICHDVIEHLADPQFTIAEAQRVLRPGGKFYCQAPFIIGYHPGPNDFWRFTKEGMAHLFSRPGWRVLKLEPAVGHGTGAYRIGVEFVAVTASCIHRSLYLLAKGVAAIALSPIKLLNGLSTPQQDRIPGEYFVLAEKV